MQRRNPRLMLFFLQLGALTRVTMMAGALETVLSLTVQHANDRMQFGRPIGKFQAVRQQIAVLGTEVAAAGKACDEAVAAFDAGEDPVRIAVAKARVSESSGICNEIAHQFHGAIGFTYEHSLHQFTRRLWSWRDDYGSEAYWNERLGRTLQTFGLERPWEFLTGISEVKRYYPQELPIACGKLPRPRADPEFL